MDFSTIWYSCTYCKAVFRSRNLLQNHKKAEHADRLKSNINSQAKKSKNSTVNSGVIQAVNKEISSQNSNNNNNNNTTSRLQQNGYQDISFNSSSSSSSTTIPSSYRYSQQQQQQQYPMPNIYREFSSSTITSNNNNNNSIPATSTTSTTNVQDASNIIRLKGASNNLNLSTSNSNGSYSNANNNNSNIINSSDKYDSFHHHYKTNDPTISNIYNNQYKTDSTHMAEPSIISKKRKVIEKVPTMKEKINNTTVVVEENVVNWRSSLPLQQHKKFKVENGGNTNNESQINTASKSNNNSNNNKSSVNMDFDIDMNVDVKYEEYLYCDRCNEKCLPEQLSEHYRMCDYHEKSTNKIKSYQQQQQQQHSHHHHQQQQQQQNANSNNNTGRYQNGNFSSPLQSYSSSSSSIPVSSSSAYMNLKLNLSNDTREDEPTVDPLSIPTSISNYTPSVIIPPTQNSTYFSPTSRITTRPTMASSTSTRIAPSTAKIPCLYCGRLFQFEREAKIHELSHINNLSITGDMAQTFFPGLYTTPNSTVIMPTTTTISSAASSLNHFPSITSTHPLSLPSQNLTTSQQPPPPLSAPHFLFQPQSTPLPWTHHGLVNDPMNSINPNSQPLNVPLPTLHGSISSDFNYLSRMNYPNPGIGIPINVLPTTTTSNTTIIPDNITPTLIMPNGTKNMSKNKNNTNNNSSNSYNYISNTSSSPYIPISSSGQLSQLIRDTSLSNNNTKATEYYPRRNRTKSLLPKIPNNNNIPQVSSIINLQNKNNALLSSGIINVNDDESNDSIKSSSQNGNTNINVQMSSIPISVIPTKYAASNTQILNQEPQKMTTKSIQSTVTPYYPKRNRTKNLISNGNNNNTNTTGNKAQQNQSFNSSVHISTQQTTTNSDNDDVMYLNTTTTNNNNSNPMHINNNNNNKNKQPQAGVTNITSGMTIKCNSGSIPLTVFVLPTKTPQTSIATTINNSSNSNHISITNGVRLNNSNNNNNNENDEDDLIIDVTNASPPPPSSSSQTQPSSSQPQFNCPSCSKSYSSEKALETHKTSVHLRDKPFKCPAPDCNKKFSHVKQLEFHALSHPSKSEKCKHCSSAFWSKTNLKEHMKDFHKNYGYMNDDDDDDDEIEEEGNKL